MHYIIQMTIVKATIDEIAKPKLDIALSVRLMSYTSDLPKFFIATYNLQKEDITIHGANTAEELNLTLSYFPDDAVMAVISSDFENNPSSDARDNDSVADLVADPEIFEGLNYNMGRKEFLLSEEELEAIAKRDGELAEHRDEIKGKFGLAVHTNPVNKVEKPKSQQPSKGGHLQLVVDNDI